MIGSQMLSGIGPAAGGGYTGPLDLTATPAVVAYGQRALSAAKLGTALYTIRRDSDDTTQSFNSGASDGTAPVAAIAAFIGGGNGFVTTWNDQSGNGSNQSAAMSANQAQWSPNISNGRPALQGVVSTASYGLHANTATVTNAGMTVFSVVKFSINDLPLIFDLISNDNSYEVTGDTGVNGIPGNIRLLLSDESSVRTGWVTSGVVADGIHILEWVWQASGAVVILVDGVDLNAATEDTPLLPLSEGDLDFTFPYSATNSFYLEHELFSAALSAPDRLAIRQNIATWYGITLS